MGCIGCVGCYYLFALGLFGVGLSLAVLAVWRNSWLKVHSEHFDGIAWNVLFKTACLLLALISLFSISVLTVFFLSPRQGLREEPPGEHGLYLFGYLYFIFSSAVALKWGDFPKAVVGIIYSIITAVITYLGFHSWSQYNRPVLVDYLWPLALGLIFAASALCAFVKQK